MKKWLFILMFAVLVFPQAGADSPSAGGPGFTMSPNPVNSTYFHVNLEFSETEFPRTVLSITNVLGQVVYTYQLTHNDFINRQIRIELSDAKLSKGVYFVQLKSGDVTKTQKLAIR